MPIYKVHICVDEVYDDIEANNEDEAFEIACEAVLSGGDWGGHVELISEEEN